MFLAWNEIKYAKLRYSMVIALMFLIAYLVFFLTGLAYGLAQSNRTAIDKWQADSILLTKDVNAKISMSSIKQEEADKVKADQSAQLWQQMVILNHKSFDEKASATILGIEEDKFLMPNIIEGQEFDGDFEVVIDESLLDKGDIKLGDKLAITGSDQELEVVGLTDQAQLNVSPVVYMNPESLSKLFGNSAGQDQLRPINGIVVRGQVDDYDQEVLELVSINDFIEALPGYSAQNMTFIFMIGFLIVIAAIVLGIFMYILTMQKEHIFGVMKVEGISTSYMARSVLAQTFILAGLGILIGGLACYGSALILPSAVPFAINYSFMGIIALLMLIVAILGALFSIKAIAKIDPLDAIG